MTQSLSKPTEGKGIKLFSDEVITGVIKTGGYYRWDWKFPFRHFVKEEIRVFTKDSIYNL